MKIILLPGVDGTGILFEPFVEIFIADVPVEVIPLTKDSDQSILNQVSIIEDAVGDEEVVLIVESYSGLLAYELARRNKVSIKQIFFFGCFLQPPSLIGKIGRFLPVRLLNIIPDKLLSHILFNRWSSPELIALFRKAVESVNFPNLKQRLKTIATHPKPTQPIDIPCVYIQGTMDNLVSAYNVKAFEELCRNLQVEVVEATHMLLQTQPETMSQLIHKYLQL
ncbi:alpha/beta fold hydrolase [Kangiella sp. M94]